MTPLSHISIVLVEPQSPGNIGAVARAMKNLGLSRLVLVNSQTELTPETSHRACGADDVVARSVRCATLREALKPFHLVVGTSSRSVPWISGVFRPSELADHLASLGEQEVALVFGPERTGLTNEHLDFCRLLVTIPTNPEFESMNLAHAVAIVAYELYQRSDARPVGRSPDLARTAELEELFDHLERCLLEIGFLDKDNPKRIMATLRQILSRAELEDRDVQILRGILRQWSWYAAHIKESQHQNTA